VPFYLVTVPNKRKRKPALQIVLHPKPGLYTPSLRSTAVDFTDEKAQGDSTHSLFNEDVGNPVHALFLFVPAMRELQK
jgi:hypothetical protein